MLERLLSASRRCLCRDASLWTIRHFGTNSEAAIDWSYELLNEDETLFLGSLSPSPGMVAESSGGRVLLRTIHRISW